MDSKLQEIRRYRNFEKGEFILVAVDTATGAGDRVAAQFLSKTKIDVPLVIHSEKSITEITPLIHQELEKTYDITGIKPVVAYERQNGGIFELERLAALNRLGKYIIFNMPTYGNIENGEERIIGWDTNSATRPAMLQDLKNGIDHKVITIYDKPTVNELFSFVTVKTSTMWKAQAEKHAHDDLVMALAIVWQMYQICPFPDIEPEDTSEPPDDLAQRLQRWY